MSENSDLKEVLVPIEAAKGLPNAYYIDDAAFNEEKSSVLFKNWSAIGFGNDVANPGDAHPVDFLGIPLVTVRDNEGDIRVFQNTCRHRGMILVNAPTNIRGPLRCPYHSWAYSLKGELKATPHVGGINENTHPCINKSELGLIEIRSYVWRDVVFVNVSGDARPFEEEHAELIERWKEFDQPMHPGGDANSFQFDVACNWKLAVENYCEAYHLPWIHPELNTVSPLDRHYHIESAGKYSGQGSLNYQQMTDDNGATLPDFSGLSEKWTSGAEYIALYPNVLLGVGRDHSFGIILEPVDKGRTIEHVQIYYADAVGSNASVEKLRDASGKRWQTVFEEDVFVVEGMQRGRKGQFFDGGKFAPAQDGPTYTFHQWVARQIEQGRIK